MSIPDSDDLDLQRITRDQATILDLGGDLDARAAPLFREHLVDAIESSGGLVVVDLTDVLYADSVGLGTLVGALKRANERGVALRFVVTRSQLLKVLDITGLNRIFEIYDTVEGAQRGRG
jgi:anti-sigma B factor antagonist